MWWEASISFPIQLKDIILGIIYDEDTKGIVEPVSDEGEISLLKAYFESDNFEPVGKRLRESIDKKAISPEHRKQITVSGSKIEDKNWGCSWAEHFRPVNVGKKLVISPPWIEYTGSDKRKNIAIYPGMAFGTGTHESTRLCLNMIEFAVSEYVKKTADSLLDIGTGSGILSISAFKLGFKRCRGIDIDDEAIRNARHNLRINGIGRGVNFTKGTPESIRLIKYSFVAANMVLNEHKGVSPYYEKLTRKGGYLAISGILKNQRRDFMKLNGIGDFFKNERAFREGEWCGLLLRRK